MKFIQVLHENVALNASKGISMMALLLYKRFCRPLCKLREEHLKYYPKYDMQGKRRHNVNDWSGKIMRLQKQRLSNFAQFFSVVSYHCQTANFSSFEKKRIHFFQ